MANGPLSVIGSPVRTGNKDKAQTDFFCVRLQLIRVIMPRWANPDQWSMNSALLDHMLRRCCWLEPISEFRFWGVLR